MLFKSKKTDQLLVCEIEAKRATLADADQFRDYLLNAIREGYIQIIVDMDSVEFIDSSFLGAMMAAMKNLNVKGGDLKICAQSEQILNLLKVTRLNRIFSVYPTVSDAESSFQTS